MDGSRVPQLQRIGTAATLAAELAHLGWEALHGGVKSHHLLNRDSLPEISNWWGALLLPLLAWHVIGRVQRRMAATGATALSAGVVVGFAGAFLFGLGLALAFATGHTAVASILFRSMLVLALLLPVYRAECVLGFVLAMAFTFGVVLPTAIASILAAFSALIHLVLRPVVKRLLTTSRRP